MKNRIRLLLLATLGFAGSDSPEPKMYGPPPADFWLKGREPRTPKETK